MADGKTSIDHANEMIETMEVLQAELIDWISKGKKAAAKRARKHTLTLQALSKNFRRTSVSESMAKKDSEGGE